MPGGRSLAPERDTRGTGPLVLPIMQAAPAWRANAVGILIVGADVILRLAAQVALSSDTTIALLLIGVLGWLLWIYVPRRRAKRR
jgi:hypothetical protein